MLTAATWSLGLVSFVRAGHRVVVIQLPARAARPIERHNLAAARYGPTLSVSSYHRDIRVQGHPAFLVDEWITPSTRERWISAPDDAAPTVTVHWGSPRTVDEVILRHEGLEDTSAVATDYRIECLHGDQAEPALEVRGNRAVVARHSLLCVGATGLSIRFALGQLVTLYELGVLGK